MLRALAEAAPAAALAAVCLLGLAIGSFLNVVIVRLPERRSLWRPGSACPGCGAPIAWYDNLPLLSFALLRGRCRASAMPISWRYPLVEAVTGAAFLSAYTGFGPTARLVVPAAFSRSCCSRQACADARTRSRLVPSLHSVEPPAFSGGRRWWHGT